MVSCTSTTLNKTTEQLNCGGGGGGGVLALALEKH